MTLATCVPPQHHMLQELARRHRWKAEEQSWSSKSFPVPECNADISRRIWQQRLLEPEDHKRPRSSQERRYKRIIAKRTRDLQLVTQVQSWLCTCLSVPWTDGLLSQSPCCPSGVGRTRLFVWMRWAEDVTQPCSMRKPCKC